MADKLIRGRGVLRLRRLFREPGDRRQATRRLRASSSSSWSTFRRTAICSSCGTTRWWRAAQSPGNGSSIPSTTASSRTGHSRLPEYVPGLRVERERLAELAYVRAFARPQRVRSLRRSRRPGRRLQHVRRTGAPFFPNGLPHVTSLGLYVLSWTYSSSTGLQDFYARENRFLGGSEWRSQQHHDPGRLEGASPLRPRLTPSSTTSRSSRTSAPARATTSSSTGRSPRRPIGAPPANSIGLQDVLPSWRWIVESVGIKLHPEMDWTDAYY